MWAILFVIFVILQQTIVLILAVKAIEKACLASTSKGKASTPKEDALKRKEESFTRTQEDLTPEEEDKRRKIAFLNPWFAGILKNDGIVQREIYLLEEKVKLEKLALCASLDQGEYDLLEEIKKELRGMKLRVWVNAQTLGDLDANYPDSAKVMNEIAQSYHDHWTHDEAQCIIRLACCARGCGCCRNPRRVPAGEEASIIREDCSHCTIECGCCVRWRGFRFPPVEAKKVRFKERAETIHYIP